MTVIQICSVTLYGYNSLSNFLPRSSWFCSNHFQSVMFRKVLMQVENSVVSSVLPSYLLCSCIVSSTSFLTYWPQKAWIRAAPSGLFSSEHPVVQFAHFLEETMLFYSGYSWCYPRHTWSQGRRKIVPVCSWIWPVSSFLFLLKWLVVESNSVRK